MLTEINQNISFRDVTDHDSVNDGACSVKGCNEWSTHYVNIKLNDVDVFIDLCDKHANELEEELWTKVIENPNADGFCLEKGCDSLISKIATIEISGVPISITACDEHARNIGNVMVRGEEVIKVPTFKCIPRKDLDGGMMFLCPYCHEWHRHGIGNGHRVAHCRKNDSPLKETGYFIEMMSPDELMKVKECVDFHFED
ncbi:hypothetical protein MettiDRAFT_2372 [Methanolobus tindarius DSM 2278]|uniref:Uncharacterized protein n=1 Tax=Methanolobus tindarius DSM 2278 TaxID=1090322 RepID=W9DQM3_METTI|nr:hypothetical protein [Methanolobus tindarius]ETA68884.1 hypothetical protein MettiDRAFT_2372 [Methanolobus tindarius DSM 2278]